MEFPTEREFNRATELEKYRLIFLKSAAESDRHPKMQSLISRAQAGLVRGRFATLAGLVASLYAALVQYLEARQLLRFGPFDASHCSGATLDDLDIEGMYRFIRIARTVRQFPLLDGTPPADMLRHLNLLNRGRITNAAVMLFGRAPQRFLISSEIKCAHFHGTEVAKPIPSYQVYKGTVFALVDQAVDFVMSKIALTVGTRTETAQAPISYEMPKDVVTEAIVNAVAHRDYTDNSSVQVMLFADRLEVMNSGQLFPPLTVEKLRLPHQSLPANPLIAESMYLLGYIEKMGTGTVDMVRRCAEAGLPGPEFEAGAGFTVRIWRPVGDERQIGSDRASGRATSAGPEGTIQPMREATQEAGMATQENEGEPGPRPAQERIVALLRNAPTMTRTLLMPHRKQLTF